MASGRRDSTPFDQRRRWLLKAGVACLAGLHLPASARVAGARELAFYNLHTGESLRSIFWEEGAYRAEALSAVDHFLRDHRTGEVRAIDTGLLDLLYALHLKLRARTPFHVISGYRSPATNDALRRRSGGIARYSLHMVGKAIDVRLPGVATLDLKRAAVALRQGGVGYYREPDFIHVDTGRVRYW